MDVQARLDQVKTGPRSISQVNQYLRCPQAYYLSRVLGVQEKPAAWLAQGVAVHKAAEEWEKTLRQSSLSDMENVFSDSYVEEIDRLSEIAPFRNWYWSGRYDGESDTERRYGLGLEQVGRYFQYYTGPGASEVVWTSPDGKLAAELDFTVSLDAIPVRGFIDAIISSPKGLIVRDNKTGVKPGDLFQLATYAVAVNKLYNENVILGDYWMGRTGKPTKTYHLADMGLEEVTAIFTRVDQAIKDEIFSPCPGLPLCRFCSTVEE